MQLSSCSLKSSHKRAAIRRLPVSTLTTHEDGITAYTQHGTHHLLPTDRPLRCLARLFEPRVPGPDLRQNALCALDLRPCPSVHNVVLVKPNRRIE